MERPDAREKVLQFIKEQDGNGIYPETWKRLANTASQDLVTNSATWHRKCYQHTQVTITVSFIFLLHYRQTDCLVYGAIQISK